MIAPTVHLNGTSKGDLLLQIHDAADAVRIALCALHDAAPNGRDYYTQGLGALKQAIEEHRARVDRLVDIRAELLAVYEAIAEQ